MEKEEQLLCNHLLDLARSCEKHNYSTASDFLSLNEQNLFLTYVRDNLQYVSYKFIGGYEMAERKIIYFEPLGVGNDIPAPLSLLSVTPLQQKFADELTHRDYLGAILNLGISRQKIGDILPKDNTAMIICMSSAAEFLCDNLVKIKHTNVKCCECSWYDFDYKPHTVLLNKNVASLRLDAVISAAFSKSRTKLSGLIENGKVFVNGKTILNNSYKLTSGDIVSVRGLGKFIYRDSTAVTKKGRLYVDIELFQ